MTMTTSFRFNFKNAKRSQSLQPFLYCDPTLRPNQNPCFYYIIYSLGRNGRNKYKKLAIVSKNKKVVKIKNFLGSVSYTRNFATPRPIATHTGNLILYTTKHIMTKTQRGLTMRPIFKDRTKVRKRVNISIHPSVKEKAEQIGDGNVSRGIEIAILEMAKTLKGEERVECA